MLRFESHRAIAVLQLRWLQYSPQSGSLASLLLDLFNSNDSPFHFSHPLPRLHLVELKIHSRLKSENILHGHHSLSIFVFSVLSLNGDKFSDGFRERPALHSDKSKGFFQIFLSSFWSPHPLLNADSTWMSHWYLIATGSIINSLSFPQTFPPSCASYLRSRCPQMTP